MTPLACSRWRPFDNLQRLQFQAKKYLDPAGIPYEIGVEREETMDDHDADEPGRRTGRVTGYRLYLSDAVQAAWDALACRSRLEGWTPDRYRRELADAIKDAHVKSRRTSCDTQKS